MTWRIAGRGPACSIPLIAAVAALFTGGCPGVAPNGNTNGNTNTNGGGTVSGQVLNPQISTSVSLLADPVSINYSVSGTPDTLSGFYVPVEATTGAATGDRVIVATGLTAGTNEAFNFDPGVAGVGFFRVGIVWTVDGTTGAAQSPGVIEVQGPPDPEFVLPAEAITTVTRGTEVEISFDAGDPDGDATWRLFILGPTDSLTVPEDELGTQIATGSGNVGFATLNTTDLAPADYQLGLSATDTGLSITNTVASGQSHRIITIPNDDVDTPIIRVVAAE